MAERWATFDCYGTLIDWNGGIRRVLAELWPKADPDRLLAVHHRVEPIVEEHGEITYREVLARSLRGLAAVEGLEVPPGRDFALADSLPDWRAFDEVPDSLRRLREAGWRTCVLSNTDPELIDTSLAQIGVPFDMVITAHDTGSYKPERDHWRVFRGRLDREPDAHLHVAASLFHDIAPCAEMGLPAVWINRLGQESELPRTAELADLAELPETLERLAGR